MEFEFAVDMKEATSSKKEGSAEHQRGSTRKGSEGEP